MTGVRASLLREAYEEVRKQRGKPEAEAEPVLAKYFKEKNMTGFLHTMPYAEDVYELRKEPTLQELRNLLERIRIPGMTESAGRGGASPSQFRLWWLIAGHSSRCRPAWTSGDSRDSSTNSRSRKRRRI